MPPSSSPPHAVTWQGRQADGYFKGVFRNKFREIPIKIFGPGYGSSRQAGPSFVVEIEGKRVGAMPSLKAAQALAELHLLHPSREINRRPWLEEAGLQQRSDTSRSRR